MQTDIKIGYILSQLSVSHLSMGLWSKKMQTHVKLRENVTW